MGCDRPATGEILRPLPKCSRASTKLQEAAASEIEKAREKADRETEQKRKEREIVAEA